MKKNKHLKKRRGFVMATVFVAMSVVMLLSSVLLLMVQVDMNRSKLNDTLLKREETLQKIADEFVKSGNLPSGTSFYCKVFNGSSTNTKTLYVSGSTIASNADEKSIDYILKITIDTSNNNNSSITLWDRKK